MRCCQGASASLLPASLRDLAFAFDSRNALALESEFHLHPHYRAKLPLEAPCLKPKPALMVSTTKNNPEQMPRISRRGGQAFVGPPGTSQAAEHVLSPVSAGSSLRP